jgi:predicted acetyltransferase
MGEGRWKMSFAMTVEYRPLTADDLEQAVFVEATSFYSKPTPERLDQLREFFPPEWTVGAFVDGRLVADVRTIPMARRINGGATGFGAVGPVACIAAYRRQGHVGKLLRLALERMREQGLALSGLFTPHDALYARYGWERSEAKKLYYMRPSDIRLRIKGTPGNFEAVGPGDWPRLDAIYRQYARPLNGPIHRVEPWWRNNVLKHWDEATGGLGDNEAFVWKNVAGEDEGYVSYFSRAMPRTDRFVPWEVVVRDFISLSGNAYLSLWQHLLTHDIATRLAVHMPEEDPFPHLVEGPRDGTVEVVRGEGPMLRVVDLERALVKRPFAGSRPVSFTMRISDPAAPWNDGVWRIGAGEGQLQLERKDGHADVELNAGTLAPLYSGFIRPEVAAAVGLLKVNRAEVLEDLREAFAVTHPPYSNDWY